MNSFGALAAAAAVCVAATAAPIRAVAADAAALSKADVVQDLTFFRDIYAPKERSYTPKTRAQMEEFIDDAIARAQPMPRYALALEFAQAQAFSNNAHTYSDYFGVDDLFHSLPISFWEFPEGAIVTRAHPEFRRLLGAKILTIGGAPYAAAAERVAKFIPGTAERKRYLTPSWLSRIEVLDAVALAHDGVAEIGFELANGEHVVEHLGAAPTPDPAEESPAWRASLVPGKGPDPWPHVLDTLKILPLQTQKPDELMATPLDDGDIVYIRSTSLSPYTDEPAAVIIKAYLIMDNLVKSGKRPDAIIVDLRYNGGGNFFNIINFSKELTGILKPRGHIYVLEGRATFSAAISFTALLKSEAHGRATLVGEEASDTPWFWSEGGVLEAPASKLPLNYRDGRHDWAHGCTDLATCYWPVVFHGVAAGSLRPDMPIEMTYADYARGEDAALDAVMADIKRRRVSTH
ncbi:MAG TPA: hypothetical protein VNH64_12720 [Parvularculaceae bacterium]|nr:hypothetical protein [Parvularculaceae bacterium]